MTAGSDKFRDTLFRFIFGREEHREWTLSLYNAVNGSTFTDQDQIRITTLEETRSYVIHNDVSFLFVGEQNQYEHQSTYNPNMPLRQLEYALQLFGDYINQNRFNKYGSKLMRLPAPKLVVFYNGSREQPEEKILFLRDAFPRGTEPDISVRVHMININYHKRAKILQACRPLKEYAWLVDRITQNRRTMEIKEAIKLALRQMPDDYIIKEELERHRLEVSSMIWGEFNQEEYEQGIRQDGKEEGLEEGREEGIEEGEYICQLKMISRKMQKGKNVFQIANEMDMEIFEVRPLIQLIKTHPHLSARELFDEFFSDRLDGQQA